MMIELKVCNFFELYLTNQVFCSLGRAEHPSAIAQPNQRLHPGPAKHAILRWIVGGMVGM